jgi:hypothetical protein
MENMLLFEQILGKGKNMNEPLISINEEFINEEEHLALLNFCKQITTEDRWIKDTNSLLWNDRTFFLQDLTYLTNELNTQKDKEIFRISLNIRQRVNNQIVNFMKINHKIYSDCLILNRWRPGDLQMPHADGEMEDGTQHPYPWREYGSVIYLNDEYEGGSIYFPQWDIEITPKPRTLAFFPGTLDYMHGVRPITNGMRYTFPSFWTSNKSKADIFY